MDIFDNKRYHKEFQSTLLMRGATSFKSFLQITLQISIHAPHARSDAMV